MARHGSPWLDGRGVRARARPTAHAPCSPLRAVLALLSPSAQAGLAGNEVRRKLRQLQERAFKHADMVRRIREKGERQRESMGAPPRGPRKGAGAQQAHKGHTTGTQRHQSGNRAATELQKAHKGTHATAAHMPQRHTPRSRRGGCGWLRAVAAGWPCSGSRSGLIARLLDCSIARLLDVPIASIASIALIALIALIVRLQWRSSGSRSGASGSRRFRRASTPSCRRRAQTARTAARSRARCPLAPWHKGQSLPY
eukprot:5526653-Prymnesium_polylepis.1